MAELPSAPGRPLAGTEAVRRTVAGLEQAGLIEGPQQVIHTWQRHVEYAYPVPTLGRDGALRRLLRELHGAGILSRGRFGAWLYETGNMDDCFMQGLEAAAHLMTDAPEATMALRLDLG
jgi:UDP-galactopyranose mutase